MNRIEAIVSNIDSNDKVADIGCDQVEVGIMLAKKGIKSIASDISINVISKAKEKINSLNLEEFIDLRVGNGIETIIDTNTDTLVLAGMGTFTILEILSMYDKRFNKIITISNNNHDILRTKMNDMNYMVSKETIIKEKNIYYNLIVFTPGNKEYTEEELLLGTCHSDIDMYKEWIIYLKDKYNSIKKNSKDKNDKIDKILYYLNSH